MIRSLPLLGLAVCSACTIPITAQTITGGVLNAGAMLFVDRINGESYETEGHYDYVVNLPIDTVAAFFEAMLSDANRAHLFPETRQRRGVPGAGPPLLAGGDAVLAASYARRTTRPGDPPNAETFPERQWTPNPLFSVGAGSPEARGDSLKWVVTHRSRKKVAFVLVARGPEGPTTLAIRPVDPPAQVFLSVPSDHAQRNAVEELHEAVYFGAERRLGEGALVNVRQAGIP